MEELMSSVRRVYVEKKPAFAVQAKDLRHELRKYLGVSGLTGVRAVSYTHLTLPTNSYV